MRKQITPVFTSGKLKQMMPIVNKIGKELKDQLQGLAERGEEFNAKQVMTNFTMDVIAMCGFGVEANSFKDPEGTFPTMVIESNEQVFKTICLNFCL